MRSWTSRRLLTGDPDVNPRGNLAVVYQRPVEDPYSGGSGHMRGFVAELRKHIPVDVVAPRYLHEGPRPPPDTLITSVSNILRSTLCGVRFALQQAVRPRKQRTRAIVFFDIYGAPVPFVWARVTGTPVVYYAQDLGEDILRAFRSQGYRGSALLRWLRGPFERLLLRKAALVVAVSDEMTQAMVSRGHARDRVLTCSMQRARPAVDLDAVREWQRRFDLERRIGIVFLGNLNYPPNRTAAEFVTSDLRPKSSQLAERAVFLLVGKGSEPFSSESEPPVHGLGPVSDLSNLLFACHIGLAPMEVAGGVSGKMVDYLIHGLRVVATPDGARGAVASDAITVCSKDRFAEVLGALVAAGARGRPGYLNPVDPRVAETYLEGGEFRRLVAVLERIAPP